MTNKCQLCPQASTTQNIVAKFLTPPIFWPNFRRLGVIDLQWGDLGYRLKTMIAPRANILSSFLCPISGANCVFIGPIIRTLSDGTHKTWLSPFTGRRCDKDLFTLKTYQIFTPKIHQTSLTLKIYQIYDSKFLQQKSMKSR